jgi:hypothetical protein
MKFLSMSNVMATSALITVLVVVAQAPADEVDAFLKSYREGRAHLVDQHERCRVSGVSTEELIPRGSAVPTRRMVQKFEYTRVGDNEKLVITPRETRFDGQEKSDAASAGVIIRRGSKLYAVKGPGDDGGYSLAFRGDLNNPKVMNNELQKNRGRFFRPSCEAPGFNLPVFLDKPELSIQSVRSENRDGERFTRVEYTIQHRDPKAPIQKAWCLLDPDSGWSLHAFETNYGGSQPYSYSGEVEYEGEKGKGIVPRPKTVRLQITMPPSVMTNRFDYDRFDLREGPPEDFSLAAYGLGEIEVPLGRPQNRLPLYLGAVAVVALILSIWVRLAIARRKRAEAAA